MDLINLKPHPMLEHWPLDEGTIEQLKASIDAYGFDPNHPVVVATIDGETVLVDGRARLAAIERLDLVPVQGAHVVVREFGSRAEVIDFVMRENGTRRHLDKSQRALLGAELFESGDLPQAVLEDLPKTEDGRSSKVATTEALGRWLRVSGRRIRDALEVIAFDAVNPMHRLVEQIRRGAMAIGGALSKMRKALGERRDHYRRNLRFQPEDAKIIDEYAELLEERGSSLSAAMVEQARRELEAAGRLGGGRSYGHDHGASKAVQSEGGYETPLQVPLQAPCAMTTAVEHALVARQDMNQPPLQVPLRAPCAEVMAPEAGTYGLQPGAPSGTLAPRQIPENTDSRQAPRARVRASSIHSPIHVLDNENLGGELELPEKSKSGLDGETLTTLVGLYNQAIDAWNAAHPSEDKVLRHTRQRPGKGMRDRLAQAWAERPDLDSWREALGYLPEMAPGALRAARITSLHRLLEPTMREPARGIILWRLVEWLDWDPAARPRHATRAPGGASTGIVRTQPAARPAPSPVAPTSPRQPPRARPTTSTDVIAPDLVTGSPKALPDPDILTPEDLEALDASTIRGLSTALAASQGERQAEDAEGEVVAAFEAWRRGFGATHAERAPTLDSFTRMALWGALRRVTSLEDLKAALELAGQRGVAVSKVVKTRLHLHIWVKAATSR